MQHIELVEGEPNEIPSSKLPPDIAKNLYDNFSREISIDFPTVLNDNYILRSNNYVGQICIPDELSIRINPKVSVSNIFRMVDYAYDLHEFDLLEGSIDVKTIEDLFEILAFILARRIIDRIQKGLYCDYVEEEDHIPYVRGRIQIAQTIRANVQGSVNLWCEFEEHTDDLEDNRILMWTLHLLRNLSFKNQTVAAKIETAYRGLLGEITIEQKDAADCVDRIYNRLNEDYRSTHLLCKFFLDSIGPAFKKGDVGFISFTLLYMPTLFEKFVAKWLEENSPYLVTPKVPLNLDSNVFPAPQYIVDVVLQDHETSDVVGLLDTKYKLPVKKIDVKMAPQEFYRTVEFNDLNQVHAYAAELNTTKALLVYPSDRARKMWVKIKDICVKTIVFDITAPDLGESQFLSDLQAALR